MNERVLRPRRSTRTLVRDMGILKAFLWTVVIEMSAMTLFSREKDAYLICFLANVATNLTLNAILLGLDVGAGVEIRYFDVWPAEAAIVAIEAFIYRRALAWRRPKAWGASFVLNALSYLIGARIMAR
ncbi:MAG: hypothetical protein ACOYH4_02700 [Saccharofermentanales bacterium]|jgi:hypothetical protein